MNSFEWVVGGIGIVITGVLLLVGYLVTKRNSTELENLKKDLEIHAQTTITSEIKRFQNKIDESFLNLENLINEKVQSAIDSMHEHVDNKWSLLESEIEEQKNKLEFERARILAISADRDGLDNKACLYWLIAANNCGTGSMRSTCVQGAMHAVEKAAPTNKNFFKRDLADIQSEIKKLKPEHEIEMAVIEQGLTKIISADDAPPALPSDQSKDAARAKTD